MSFATISKIKAQKYDEWMSELFYSDAEKNRGTEESCFMHKEWSHTGTVCTVISTRFSSSMFSYYVEPNYRVHNVFTVHLHPQAAYPILCWHLFLYSSFIVFHDFIRLLKLPSVPVTLSTRAVWKKEKTIKKKHEITEECRSCFVFARSLNNPLFRKADGAWDESSILRQVSPSIHYGSILLHRVCVRKSLEWGVGKITFKRITAPLPTKTKIKNKTKKGLRSRCCCDNGGPSH